jgi:hypothetical protein
VGLAFNARVFLKIKSECLSVFETIFFSLVYLNLAVTYGTLHLTFAVILLPIFLLRTENSVNMAINSCISYQENAIEAQLSQNVQIKKPSLSMLFFAICIYLISLSFYTITEINMLSIYGENQVLAIFINIGILFSASISFHCVLIRFISTAKSTLTEPSVAISSIPKNWWHQIACLDSTHPPELIPGIINYENKKKYISSLQPFGYFNAHCTKLHIFGYCNQAIVSCVCCVFTTITTYIFRWSMKGTALLMLPMIWLLYDSKTTTPEYVTKSLVMKNLFRFSCLIFLCFGVFGLKRMTGIDLNFYLPDNFLKLLTLNDPHGLINKIFPEDRVMLWQGFLWLTALLTVSCYLFADRLVNRGHGDTTLWWFRQLCSSIGVSAVFLIFSLVYLSARIAQTG